MKAIDLLEPNVWLELDEVSFPRFFDGAVRIFQTNPRVAKFGRAYVKQDDQPPQTPTEAIRFGLYLFASHPYRGGRCDPWWAAPSFFGQRRHLPSLATCLFPKT